MKVQMVAQISGTRDGIDWPHPGEILDTSDREAAELIAEGFAKAVVKVAKVETAEKIIPVETATRKGLTKTSI